MHHSPNQFTSLDAADSLVATYNDLDSVAKLFEANPDKVACVIVEPMLGNHGALVPTLAFLQASSQLAMPSCLWA